MNVYYINNRLQMNVTKTNVMIISDNKEDNENYITIENNTIRNQDKIIILGTTKITNSTGIVTYLKESFLSSLN